MTAAERWNAVYVDGRPPWDIGRPQPAVVRLAEAGAFRSRFLDAGCGTGENTLLAASLGVDATGVDLAPTAIERARAKAAARGLVVDFRAADALDLSALERSFESVLDCGLFHTFSDELRPRYVASLRRVIAPGARLSLLCFSEREPWDGGPRRVTQAEIRAAFAHGWDVRSIEPERFATRWHDVGAEAWLATIERLGGSGSGVEAEMPRVP